MAHARKNNRSQSKQKAGKNDRFKIIRAELTAEDKAKLGKSDIDPVRLSEWIFAVVEKGYKFSVSPADDEGTCTASLYDRASDSPTHEYTLLARSKSPERAVLALQYKHEVFFDGVWPDPSDIDDEWG